MSKHIKRLLSIMLVIAIVFCLGPVFKVDLHSIANENSNYVYFGSYQFDGDNKPTPLKWQIINEQDGFYFLVLDSVEQSKLSNYLIDDSNHKVETPLDYDFYWFLNDDFANKAFSISMQHDMATHDYLYFSEDGYDSQTGGYIADGVEYGFVRIIQNEVGYVNSDEWDPYLSPEENLSKANISYINNYSPSDQDGIIAFTHFYVGSDGHNSAYFQQYNEYFEDSQSVDKIRYYITGDRKIHYDNVETLYKKSLAVGLQDIQIAITVKKDSIYLSEANNAPTKKIGFKYLSTYKDKEKNEIEGATYCYYSDDYFSDNPFEDGYNASLATMSMALAWSTFNSPDGGKTDYSNKFKNAKQLMDNIGMKEIETNSFYSEKPFMDSIGVICGNKSITINGNKYTLIACAIRGGGYESEWSSNFTIGTSGEHEGFADAKKKVLVYLKGYIDNNNIKGNVKFWITGYSRAAATANLTAAAIDDRSANLGNTISYAPKDVYAYTFETPAGAIDNVKYSKIYENIFNIINPSDPVPYVAPSRIGFGRYGIDYYYPTIGVNRKYGDSKRNMKAIFDSLPYSDLLVSDSNKRVYDRVDSFKMKIINYEAVKAIQLNASEALSPNDANIVIDDTNNIMVQSCFLNEFFDTISDDVMIDRNNFVKQYQEVLRDFFRITNGNSEIYKQFFKELKESNIIRKVLTAVNPNPLIDVLLDCLFACFAVSASDQVPNKTELLDIVIKGAPLIYRIVQANPDYFATLLSNADGIGCGHYPELCFSWVASMDKNYNPNAKVTFTPFAYRKVRINCDVNVSVYDSNNTLVAQINNEKATDLNNDYMYGIDNDGQKFVILPIDEDYTIEIQAYNDTVVNYGVSEYSADAGTYTRNVNFFDIKLDKDEKITGDVSSYLPEEIETDTMQASHATYTIKDTNDVVIKASSDLKDEESVNATYYVDASSSNDEHGLVYGAGSHQFGHYAQLEAAAKEGYKFIGWFIDNDLVSAESSYRFRVDSDIKVIGKFDKLTDDSESQNVDTKLNGIVQGPDGKWAMYKEGIVDTSATGVFQNKFGWWRVEKGYVNFDAQGIYQNQYGWWKTTNGKVTFKENGVFQNENGWWRVKDSKVDFDANGIYQNQYGWWKTTKGKVTFKENGVFKNEYGWWKVKNSKVDFGFTGIASNKYGTWYINKGKVDFSKNGKVNYNNKSYNIKGGKVV